MRRSLLVATRAALAAAAAVPLAAAATPAHAATPPVGLVIPILAPMLPGQSGWVSALWGTLADVCDVKATATGSGVSVSYPSNTGTYSSFSRQDSLAAGHVDYTAFKLALNASTAAATTLDITLTYTEKTGTGTACTGTAKTLKVAATVPVVRAAGAAVVQKTSSVTVPRATPVWTELAFAGRKTGLTDFRVSLDAPNGLAVTYPGDKTSAGLNDASTLTVGDDDFVAVRVDATGAKPGAYKIPVHATYSGGSYDGSLTVVVS